MANRRNNKVKSKKSNESVSVLYVDIVALVLLCTSILVFLSLISFSPEDPTLFNSAVVSKMVSKNLMGNFGAHLSALLLHFFGYASYLIPVFFVFMATTLFLKGNFKQFLIQIPMFIGELIVSSVLFSSVFTDFVFISSDVPLEYESAGGVIGNTIKGVMFPAFNYWGTLIILIFLIIAMFMIGARVGLTTIATGISKLFSVVFTGLKTVFLKIKGELSGIKKVRKVTKEIESDRKRKKQMAEKIQSKELAPIIDMPYEDDEQEDGDDMSPLDIALKTGLTIGDSKDYAPPWKQCFADPDMAQRIDKKELARKADLVVKKLAEFDVTGKVVNIHPGPVVTTYEFQMDPGIKFNKILGLSQDLCMALSAESVRIDRMYKKPTVGIEVPNDKRKLIVLKEILETKEYLASTSPLTIVLGETITGQAFVGALDKMPHLLIAGQTGSGKSVGLNAILCSILVRNAPDRVKFIMVDPKMVELGIYSDIPHLLTDVIVDPKEAASALTWAVSEMERRYKLLKQLKVRNLDKYNTVVESGVVDETYEKLPYIVVIIDELADLIMVARAQVEESIARLAQKARAVGIHLILATQRPSRDIITGVIKSNLPSRISYKVAQMMDSRIILDRPGAEQLLGKGDMLFIPPGTSSLVRIHSPYIDDGEINQLVEYLKEYGKPSYMDNIKSFATDEGEKGLNGDGNSKFGSNYLQKDPVYRKAVKLVVATGGASISNLQRKLSIGYNKAARYIDFMEEEGIVGPPAKQSGKQREVLVDSDFLVRLEEMEND